MLRLGCFFFVLFISLKVFGFTTTIVYFDTPILYKRFIEVTTLYSSGSDLPGPFFYTMVMDMRLPTDGLRVVMSGISFEHALALEAHEEGCKWATRRYAHLRIQVPDDDDTLVLRYLEPTVRHSRAVTMNFSHSDPTNASLAAYTQLLLSVSPTVLIHSTPELEDEPSGKKRKLD